MTQDIRAVDFNGVKVRMNTTTKLIHLFSPNIVGPETLHNREDNANYQVPAGKKATVIFITLLQNFTVTDRVIFADDADGTLNEVDIVRPNGPFANLIFISQEIPALKFINKVAGDNDDVDLTIIEEDV